VDKFSGGARILAPEKTPKIILRKKDYIFQHAASDKNAEVSVRRASLIG
jgi:hypothetical protein